MKIEVNRESGTPIYRQLHEQIRRQILSGKLPPGYRLPSERSLSERLGLNRTTVLNAYGELKAEGLIGSRVGDGTVVLPGIEGETSLPVSHEPAWNQVFNSFSARFDSFLINDLLELASRADVISFATGIASPDSGPIEALRGMEEKLVNQKNYRALIHTPTEGLFSLRQAVCVLMQKRGVYCEPEEIMMLSGSQQGIDLAARILIDPGDVVILEEPTYFPAIQTFRAAGARLIGIPTDEHGMQVDVLEATLRRMRPKLIYTIPTFQNPTGSELSLERRKRLVELASRYHVMILEDDAYGDLCYEGAPMPMLKSLDSDGFVIYLSTFSKNIFSGLRLGWMVAHKRIIRAFSSVKQISDLHSGSLSQWIVEQFITSGNLEAHLKKVCVEYAERRDLMCRALTKYAPDGMFWNAPRGGYYLWCKLPDGISSTKLVAKASEHRVSFVPGPPFYSSENGDDRLRLNFTFAPAELIDEGVNRLCSAIRQLSAENNRHAHTLLRDINPIV